MIQFLGCGDGVFELHGVVRDEDGNAIAEADIEVGPVDVQFDKGSCRSQTDGSFAFIQVCAPNRSRKRRIHIITKKDGFQTVDEKIEVTDSMTGFVVVMLKAKDSEGESDATAAGETQSQNSQ